MATDEEAIKLVLQVQGQDEAEKLRDKIEELRQKILAMPAGMSASDTAMVTMAKQMKEMTKQADELDKKFGKAGGGMAGFGQAAMQSGRVLQDFAQGGIGGILNNIEGLVQSLGAGAGLAGVLTIAGVAFATFRPQIEAFLGSLFGAKVDDFRTSVEKMTDRVKELNEQPIKIGADFRELDELKVRLDKAAKEKAAFDALMSGKSKGQSQAEAAFADALINPGGDQKEIANRLKGPARADAMRKDAEFAAMGEAAREAGLAEHRAKKTLENPGMLDNETQIAMMAAADEAEKASKAAQERVDAKRKQIEAEADARIEGLFANASKGDARARKELIERMKEAGVSKEKIESIEKSSPEALKHKAEAAKVQKEELDQIKAGIKAADEDAKEDAKAHKESNDANKQLADALLREAKAADAAAKDIKDKARAARAFWDQLNDAAGQDARDREREKAREVRIGHAAGMLPWSDNRGHVGPVNAFIDAQMMMARNVADRQMMPRNMAELRRAQRAPLGALEAARAKAADVADENMTQQLQNHLFKTGQVPNLFKARDVAQRMVAERRDMLNGVMNDPATKAQEETVRGLDRLRESVDKLAREGVPMKFAD